MVPPLLTSAAHNTHLFLESKMQFTFHAAKSYQKAAYDTTGMILLTFN